MNEVRPKKCSVCEEEKAPGQVWFLLAESHAEDRIRILQWEEEIAHRHGIFHACCPGHAEELVVHWMTTGSLDFPFAAMADNGLRRDLRTGSSLPWIEEPDTRGAWQIGELAVDRESIARILNESPLFLQIILDELCDALQRETRAPASRLESGEELHLSLLRHA